MHLENQTEKLTEQFCHWNNYTKKFWKTVKKTILCDVESPGIDMNLLT